MRHLAKTVLLTLLAICLVVPLALCFSGEYSRAAANEVNGYVELNMVLRDGLPADAVQPTRSSLPIQAERARSL